MSQAFSRRDFLTFLTSPLTRTAKLVAAREQRAQAAQLLLRPTDAQTECVRCYAPFRSEADETFCPTCREVEAKNRALMQSLFKPK